MAYKSNRGPVAINANTTYGVNQSASNNYGLGKSYVSTRAINRRQRAQAAQPSWLWFVGFIVFLGVL